MGKGTAEMNLAPMVFLITTKRFCFILFILFYFNLNFPSATVLLNTRFSLFL